MLSILPQPYRLNSNEKEQSFDSHLPTAVLASVCGAPQRRTEPLYDSAAHLKPHHPPHVLPRACRPPSAICGRQSRALTHFLTNMPLHTLWEDFGFLYPEHGIMPFDVSHIPILTHKRSILTVVLVLSHDEGES